MARGSGPMIRREAPPAAPDFATLGYLATRAGCL